MTSQQEYRRFAVECIRMVESTKDNSEREIFLLEIADVWTLLALLSRDTSRQSSVHSKRAA